MPSLFLLISHELTDDQRREASEALGCERIVSLPGKLQTLWSSVDPDLESVDDLLQIFIRWLEAQSRKDDFCHIQGDFGMTFALVAWAWRNGRIPVYAATERVYEQQTLGNGKVRNTHFFRHVRYRRYPQV